MGQGGPGKGPGLQSVWGREDRFLLAFSESFLSARPSSKCFMCFLSFDSHNIAPRCPVEEQRGRSDLLEVTQLVERVRMWPRRSAANAVSVDPCFSKCHSWTRTLIRNAQS